MRLFNCGFQWNKQEETETRRQSDLSIVRGRESQGPDVQSKCSVGDSGAAGS